MFEILHFRESEEIFKEKRLLKDVQATMQYVDDVLAGSGLNAYATLLRVSQLTRDRQS